MTTPCILVIERDDPARGRAGCGEVLDAAAQLALGGVWESDLLDAL